MGEIYKITCIPTQKSYIGKVFSFRPNGKKRGILARWSDHKSEALRPNPPKNTCAYLNRAIRKYGADNFELEVVHYTEDEAELSTLEQEYIEYYNSLAPNGYNLTKGGEGCRASDELKQIMSERKDHLKKEIIIWNEKEPNNEYHFESFHDAGRKLGFHAGSIRRSCEVGYSLGKKNGIKYFARYKGSEKIIRKKKRDSRKKLSPKKCEDIRFFYNLGIFDQYDLSNLYNVSQPLIHKVITTEY